MNLKKISILSAGAACLGALAWARKKIDSLHEELLDKDSELTAIKDTKDMVVRLQSEHIDYISYKEWQMIQTYRNSEVDDVRVNLVC